MSERVSTVESSTGSSSLAPAEQKAVKTGSPKPVTFASALNTALADAMEADEKVVIFGEDVGKLGGVFRVTSGLQERFGNQRCFNTPLAEAGIAGLAVGMAARGYRPVIEMQFDGFTFPAFEQIISHIAKYRTRTEGMVKMPITIRIPSFAGVGAVEHHSESPETYFVHTAGLKVVVPATPSDAYSLLREAIATDDPVVFLEPKRRYWAKETLELPVRKEPIGTAVVRRRGEDVTVLAYGPMVGVAMEAADMASKPEAGDSPISIEVIDLRSLTPLDMDTVVASVRRTGRCVVVHEAARTLGMGSELAAAVTERCFFHMQAPVLRATGFDTPQPPPRMEDAWLPDAERVLDKVDLVMDWAGRGSSEVTGLDAAETAGEGES